jgi:hypothetical protein
MEYLGEFFFSLPTRTLQHHSDSWKTTRLAVHHAWVAQWLACRSFRDDAVRQQLFALPTT